MAAVGDDIVTYVFTGEEERDEEGDYIIPRNVTHLLYHESITVIPEYLVYEHPNIIEVYCHAGVRRIEQYAFERCPRLKRVIIPGAEFVGRGAFSDCETITYIECPKLERIGDSAFQNCKTMRDIDLTSAKVVEEFAFEKCEAITEVKFGKKLETIEMAAFLRCPSLERITIPLKNGLITEDDTFQGCDNLKCVDLVDGAVLRETVSALHLEEWRNDINEELDSINRILTIAPAGYDDDDIYNDGEKAIVIEDWIERVLSKTIHYKIEHRSLLNEATATLNLALPTDIVMNYLLPFLELPSHTFEGEDEN